MEQQENQIDVLIVGAGPTGLTLSHELSRHGISHRIIEKELASSVHSKALGIQPRTLEVFDDMGVISEVMRLGNPLKKLQGYVDGKNHINLNFDELESPYPNPVILAQQMTEEVLIKAIRAKGINVEREVELIEFTPHEEHVEIKLNHKYRKIEFLKAKWVIGCDGAHSTVRHGLNLPFEGHKYPERFLLADTKLEWSGAPNVGFVFLKPQGVLAAVPMQKGYYRIITTLNSDIEQFKAFNPREFLQERLKYYTGEDYTIGKPDWISAFKIHRRIVPKMREGRVFLAGDSAHIHSPVGGQGMNTGIQDAHNLAWKLAMHIKGQVNETFLDSYNQERHKIASHVLFGTNLAMKVLFLKNPILRALRNYFIPRLIEKDFVQKHMKRAIGELSIEYADSPIVKAAEGIVHRPSLVGHRAPNCEFSSKAANQLNDIFSIIRGTHHTLLLFLGDEGVPDRLLAHLVSGLTQTLQGIAKCYVISVKDEIQNLDPACEQLFDFDKAAHHTFHCDKGGIVLIRPDGYIGFTASSINFDAFTKYIQTHYSV